MKVNVVRDAASGDLIITCDDKEVWTVSSSDQERGKALAIDIRDYILSMLGKRKPALTARLRSLLGSAVKRITNAS